MTKKDLEAEAKAEVRFWWGRRFRWRGPAAKPIGFFDHKQNRMRLRLAIYALRGAIATEAAR